MGVHHITPLYQLSGTREAPGPLNRLTVGVFDGPTIEIAHATFVAFVDCILDNLLLGSLALRSIRHNQNLLYSRFAYLGLDLRKTLLAVPIRPPDAARKK